MNSTTPPSSPNTSPNTSPLRHRKKIEKEKNASIEIRLSNLQEKFSSALHYSSLQQKKDRFQALEQTGCEKDALIRQLVIQFKSIFSSQIENLNTALSSTVSFTLEAQVREWSKQLESDLKKNRSTPLVDQRIKELDQLKEDISFLVQNETFNFEYFPQQLTESILAYFIQQRNKNPTFAKSIEQHKERIILFHDQFKSSLLSMYPTLPYALLLGALEVSACSISTETLDALFSSSNWEKSTKEWSQSQLDYLESLSVQMNSVNDRFQDFLKKEEFILKLIPGPKQSFQNEVAQHLLFQLNPDDSATNEAIQELLFLYVEVVFTNIQNKLFPDLPESRKGFLQLFYENEIRSFLKSLNYEDMDQALHQVEEKVQGLCTAAKKKIDTIVKEQPVPEKQIPVTEETFVLFQPGDRSPTFYGQPDGFASFTEITSLGSVSITQARGHQMQMDQTYLIEEFGPIKLFAVFEDKVARKVGPLLSYFISILAPEKFSSDMPTSKALENLYHHLSSALYKMGEKQGNPSMVLCAQRGNEVYTLNHGPSKAILSFEHQVLQLSRDNSLKQIQKTTLPKKHGDKPQRLILADQGTIASLGSELAGNLAHRAKSAQEASKEIITTAYHNGCKTNLTAMVVDLG